MVILEGTTMLQVGNNQYLQPDYLSPLPTTLDAKKSPLALLAQTCSQIGADPGNITVKSLVSPSDKNKKSASSNSNNSTSSSGSNSSASSSVDPTSHSSSRSPSSVKTDKSDASPEIKLGFKPYEMNVLTTKVNLSKSVSVAPPTASSSSSLIDDRPSSKMSSGSDVLNNNSVSQINNNNNHLLLGAGDGRKEQRALSPRGSADSPMSSSGRVGSASVKSMESGLGGGGLGGGGESVSNKCNTPDGNRRGTPSDREKSGSSGSGGHSSSNSPSSGMLSLHASKEQQLAGQLAPSAHYKTSAYGISVAGLPSPSGIDHTNPAFRPPFAGAFSHHHAAMLAAAGYSGAAAAAAAATAAGANPYLSYTRVKTPSGGETLVPICKDPYCTGCQFSAHNHQMMMGSQCPAGCTQCDHQKYMAMALSSMPPSGYPGYPTHAAAAAAAAAAVAAANSGGGGVGQPPPTGGSGGSGGRPYMCNWVVGDSYCGKRFNTTDELLSHLRSHTANLSDPAALALQQQLMPLSGIFPPTSMHHHRGYPNPPLSPLSAARYHPYVKPGSLPTGLPGSPYSAAAFNPAAAFGQYYSPYAAALYGQRMGAAVHQ